MAALGGKLPLLAGVKSVASIVRLEQLVQGGSSNFLSVKLNRRQPVAQPPKLPVDVGANSAQCRVSRTGLVCG
jgi:hypothetical protein